MEPFPEGHHSLLDQGIHNSRRALHGSIELSEASEEIAPLRYLKRSNLELGAPGIIEPISEDDVHGGRKASLLLWVTHLTGSGTDDRLAR